MIYCVEDGKKYQRAADLYTGNDRVFCKRDGKQ